MKKAFDQNVSRARPRLRVGVLTEAADQAAASLGAPEPEVQHEPAPEREATMARGKEPELSAAVKVRTERARAPKPSAAEAVQRALDMEPSPVAAAIVAKATAAVLGEPVPVEAVFEPPAHLTEVQTPHAPPEPVREAAPPENPERRREKLKERLRAVRENPRPEPLPPTVAEAGVLAVERIATLQTELYKVKALNLALTQDLEGARRQAEKATEEARLRMDESRRLSTEMQARLNLLQELERELKALEGERDDALLALQESRQGLQGAAGEKDALQAEIAKRDAALAESLAEEERLCAELEFAREDTGSLRRTVEALTQERDTLARQVSELTQERAELLEARKALEAVHRALSQAVAR